VQEARRTARGQSLQRSHLRLSAPIWITDAVVPADLAGCQDPFNWVCLTFRAVFVRSATLPITVRMRKNMDWAPGPSVRIVGVERDGDRWVISAVGPGIGSCPQCNEPSTRRHSRYVRHLQDLPAQGSAVVMRMEVSRWRCLNRECQRRTFADRLPEIVCPHGRRTDRTAELVHLFGHGTGGRPGERLMKRLGMPVSDDTILRHLKRHVARRRRKTTIRVAGIDDWSWSRVDRSTGRALLPEANDEGVAAIASGPAVRRDIAEHRCLTRQAHRRSRQAIFD
jgi:hypothetical protein